jgi:hypothetical protein
MARTPLLRQIQRLCRRISHSNDNPHSLGSYSYFKVGQYTTICGAAGERSGNCHFAGEHCSVNYQGYMEGGAAEGAHAANEVIADLRLAPVVTGAAFNSAAQFRMYK